MKQLLVLISSFALALNCLAADKFKTMHVADLEKALAGDKTVQVYDANGDSTRKQVGLIHGAHSLSSYDKFPSTELPTDKATPIVFYCANTMCTASHDAADRAVGMGYKNVSVMVDGIYGWKKAGKQIDKASTSDRPASDPSAPTDNAKEITPMEAKKFVDQKRGVILDVREPEERHEVVPSALAFPLSKDGTPAWEDFVKTLDKNKTVIVHCAMGKRAKKVADQLAKAGFHTSYFKGPDQWKEAGLPLQAGPAL